jgi:putative membrane protein
MHVTARRYSSLFTLPSSRGVAALLLTLCFVASVLPAVIASNLLGGLQKSLEDGLLLAIAAFLVTALADFIISRAVLKEDQVFDLRRTLAVSVFCWGVWLVFLLIGSVFGAATHDIEWWIRLGMLGFSAALILRFIGFNAVSSAASARTFLASVLQPFLGVVPFLVLWTNIGYLGATNLVVSLASSVVVSFAAIQIFFYILNRMGTRTIGVQSVALFRAFMLNWVSDLNAPFEELLEKLGEERSVEVSVLRFDSSHPKLFVVVPAIHPGPFKNVGSSLLPAILKADLEKEFSVVTCVPHGLSGHENDLASQVQNKKVTAEVTAMLKGLEPEEGTASPFVTVSNDFATACCQVLGNSAFISFTLAPQTIEDLPDELEKYVREEAEKRGLDLCVVVNAHNSISGAEPPRLPFDSLREVATMCLDKTLLLKRSCFEVGAASVLPKEFSLKDGMGSGGITVYVVKTAQQKAAYVVIDGNNMVTGLREAILSSFQSLGINGGEVFTSDTHEVSALVLTGRGYHPVGEVMDKDKLIHYITDTAKSALANLEAAKAVCKRASVSTVKVIGAKQLGTLMALTDQAIRRAKEIVVPVFGISGFILLLILLRI